MKRLFIILFAFSYLHITAQTQGSGTRGGGNPSGMPSDGVISGTVTERDVNIPMEFVNIVLFRSRDSSMVTGTITNETGKFVLSELPYGRYYLTANFIGYERQFIDSVFITPNRKINDLGTIKLQSATTYLEGVEVVADRDRVVYQIDKKVVNVSQDLQSAGGTAIDVLENVPSVQVDIEGNVSLRGSGNFTVLVDGRPSVIEASDLLQQIPASSIEHIEIITNPSARYDPEGTAGIINVVTKKTAERGMNGIINASVGTKNKYSGDILINYRVGKVNIFGGADLGIRRFSGKGTSVNETYFSDYTQSRISDSWNKMKRDSYGIRGGIDYMATSKATISLSGKYGYYNFGRDRNAYMQFVTLPATTGLYSNSINSSYREGKFYEINANYLQKLNDKGQKLEMMAYFSNRDTDSEDEQIEFPTDQNWENPGNPYNQIRSLETGNTYDYLIKADYTLPINDASKFEAGYQSRFYYDMEDYAYFNFDTLMQDWQEDEQYRNAFEFNRNIHSVYSIFASQWKGFGYQLGLRGEYMNREIQNALSPDVSVLNRPDFFPSVHISKEFLDKNQVMMSYSRRINRVRPHMLDPYISFWDPYNVRQGNPNLKDEYIDSYDLGYQRRFKGAYIALETYYRVTHNKLTRVSTLQDNGILLSTWDNLDKDHSLGTEVSGNVTITQWLSVFASANLFYYRLEGQAEGQQVKENSLNWSSRLTASVNLKNDYRIQFSSQYNGPSVTLQGETIGSYMASLSARKDFFNRKLSLTLAARDIFGTGKFGAITYGQDFYNKTTIKRESPIIMLNVTYRINNYRQTQRQQQESMDRNGVDEMDM
ncbi:MAG: TonB-dependent receptor [Bacteroidales bacterium]|nr:TonB-dependent receptor [Bacteroidales bacterium]